MRPFLDLRYLFHCWPVFRVRTNKADTLIPPPPGTKEFALFILELEYPEIFNPWSQRGDWLTYLLEPWIQSTKRFCIEQTETACIQIFLKKETSAVNNNPLTRLLVQFNDQFNGNWYPQHQRCFLSKKLFRNGPKVMFSFLKT